VPFLSTLIITYTKQPLSGLWYPIIVGGICFIIGALYLSAKSAPDIADDVNVYVR